MQRRDQTPVARVVQRALDSLRLVLVSALGALLYWQPGEPAVALDTDIRVGIGAAAGAYALVIVATWAMWSSRRWRRRSVGPFTLLLADFLVAVGILLAGDPSTEILTWIPFLFPIVSGAAMFGVGAAALAWMAISAVYLPIRVHGTTGDATREALEVGVRSLGALAVFGGVAAVSTVYVHRRLLAARSEMRDAERFAAKLGEISLASRHLRAQSTTQEVLRGAVHNATRLGFADADVCERRESRPWSVTFTSRRGARPAADAELLSSAAVHSRGTVTRSLDNHEENSQALHIAARRAVMATPIASEPGHWLVLRAWVHEDDPLPDHRDRQALELLAAIVGDAWRNAQQMRNLEDRSKALAQQANHDALTGVANRGWMLRHLGSRLQPDYGPSQPTALLYVDLEGFKDANEAHGHEVGDRALVEVARRIRDVVPEEHSVGRLGGDEFLAVVDLTTRDDPLRLAEAICATLGEPIEIDEASITIGASVGIALAEPEVEPEELIKRADAAVYVSRQAGGSTKLQRTRPDRDPADPAGVAADSVDWTEDFALALESEAASLPSWAQDLVDAAEAAAQLAEALPDDWDADSAGNPFGEEDETDDQAADADRAGPSSAESMAAGRIDAVDREEPGAAPDGDAWLIALQDGTRDQPSLDEMQGGDSDREPYGALAPRPAEMWPELPSDESRPDETTSDGLGPDEPSDRHEPDSDGPEPDGPEPDEPGAGPRRLSAHDRYSLLVHDTAVGWPEPGPPASEPAPAEPMATEPAPIEPAPADAVSEPAPVEPAPADAVSESGSQVPVDGSPEPVVSAPVEFPPYVVEPVPWPEGPVTASSPDAAGEVEPPETEIVTGETDTPETEIVTGETDTPETVTVAGETDTPETVTEAGETEIPETEIVTGGTEIPETEIVTGGTDTPETVTEAGGTGPADRLVDALPAWDDDALAEFYLDTDPAS